MNIVAIVLLVLAFVAAIASVAVGVTNWGVVLPLQLALLGASIVIGLVGKGIDEADQR